MRTYLFFSNELNICGFIMIMNDFAVVYCVFLDVL